MSDVGLTHAHAHFVGNMKLESILQMFAGVLRSSGTYRHMELFDAAEKFEVCINDSIISSYTVRIYHEYYNIQRV